MNAKEAEATEKSQDTEIALLKHQVNTLDIGYQRIMDTMKENHKETRESLHSLRNIVAHQETVVNLEERVDVCEKQVASITQSKKFISENWFNLIKTLFWLGAAIFAVSVWKSAQDRITTESINVDKVHSEQIAQISKDVHFLISQTKKSS